jgi:predicted glycogen debranching enzyme
MASLDLSQLGLDALVEREWLASNGLGGYSCSTVPGLNTRKYHGLLVAAMLPPVRRMVLLSRVEEFVRVNGWPFPLACSEYPGTIHPDGHRHLRAFGRHPYPRWAFQGEGWTIERGLRLLHGANTVVLSYTLLGGDHPVELELRPLLALRPIHELMYQWNGRLNAENRGRQQQRIPPTARTPEVFLAHDGAFDPDAYWYLNTIYRSEAQRGYSGLEDLWNPGIIRWALSPGQSVHFACSTDPIDLPEVLAQAEKQFAPRQAAFGAIHSSDEPLDALVRAAAQFVVSVPQESGAAPSVVAGYPWLAPSGRDALMAFAGLMLVPGRFDEAKGLLLSLAGRVRRGLIPTTYPEDGSAPVYDGADTSLWFINAVHQYLCYCPDDQVARQRLLESVVEIVRAYQHGTDLGIRLGTGGLLEVHAPGVATSWMDAHVDGWVVTPRTGRPVELNALWYNALRIAAELSDRAGRSVWAAGFAAQAAKMRQAFNDAFWNERSGCCYDVVSEHGHDPSVRPNQLLAMSLPFAVLEPSRFAAVLGVVMRDLRVPIGVRTLAPGDPAYQGRYAGDVVARDRAYHNGSAYAWLLGPLVGAYLRVHGKGEPARREALAMIQPCLDELTGNGLGCLRELFDGDAPHRPGGAVTSALNVGELLRCYAEDVLDLGPGPELNGTASVAAPVRPRSKRQPGRAMGGSG